MVRFTLCFGFLLGLAGQEVRAEHGQNEEAIKALDTGLKDWLSAYNRHDAEALAEFYTEDADVVHSDGEILKGRDAFQKSVAAYFKENPNVQLSSTVISRRFLKPDMVMEEGTWKDSGLSGSGPENESGTYIAIIAKKNGKWLTVSERGYLDAQRKGSSPKWEDEEWEKLTGVWRADYEGGGYRIKRISKGKEIFENYDGDGKLVWKTKVDMSIYQRHGLNFFTADNRIELFPEENAPRQGSYTSIYRVHNGKWYEQLRGIFATTEDMAPDAFLVYSRIEE